MKKLLQMIKENRIVTDIFAIFLVTLILMIPSFNKNTDIYLDDGSQHLMRAWGAYNSLKQNGTANVISSFGNGFGYSWNLFYGPLSADLIMVLGIIFSSFNRGFKLALAVIMFASGACMYKFVAEMTENRNMGLLAAIIYIASPYLFTDIYVRHAIGEACSFVFMPLVFLGLYNLFNTEKSHYYLVFGATRTYTFTQYFNSADSDFCIYLLYCKYKKFAQNASKKRVDNRYCFYIANNILFLGAIFRN